MKKVIFMVLFTIALCTLSLFNIAKAADTVEYVPNGSLEQSSGSLPTDWKKNTYLKNTAIFSYLNNGRTGSHSIKVQITKYTSGDSKWFFTPQVIPANTTLQYSVWYKADIDSEVDAEITKSNGTKQYIILGKPKATGEDWTNFKASFKTPKGTKKVTIYHMIKKIGYLQTDDYSLISNSAPIPTPEFNRGLLSIAFDDGYESIYKNGFPVMKKYQTPGTIFLVTNYLNTPGYMTTEMAKEMKLSGFSVGSHTVSHAHLANISQEQVDLELKDSKTFLENLFGQVNNFASPFGEYNSSVINTIKKYYTSHRTTNSGYNVKSNFNAFALKSTSVKNTTQLSDVSSWISEAQNTKGWLILNFHDISSSDDLYANSAERLDYVLADAASKQIPILNFDQAINEISPQLVN